MECVFKVLQAVVALQAAIAACKEIVPDPQVQLELQDFREFLEEILEEVT